MILGTQQLLVKIFEHYFNQAYSDGSFRLNLSNNQKLIDGFFERLSKNGYSVHSIGFDFINRFLLFQFEYWKEKETAKAPTLSWFIGSKSLERFESVKDWQSKNYWVSINTENLIGFSQKSNQEPFENEQRKRFHNTERGLTYCLENTSLYSKSVTCFTCHHKEKCKKLLKENYPLLYRRRIK